MNILAFLSAAAIAALAAGLALMTVLWHRQRRRAREEGQGRPWRIRRVPVEAVDPVFTPHASLGHLHDTAVTFISRGTLPLTGATSDHEAWVLAVLARRATTMFEFGTATGRTAYLWACNAPATACVYTLTLAPDERDTYQRARGDDPDDVRNALSESVHDTFLYSGTDVAGKVAQLFGDSKTFDESPYLDRCDLIFIDGSHAYSYVVSDSAKALRMVKPGGLVLWHDYRGPHLTAGVYRALNELADTLPLVQIAGTSFVAYRRPVT